MVDTSLTNAHLIGFRRSVAVRELELAAAYPQIRSSSAGRRVRAPNPPARVHANVWPSPAVMPGDKELHDFVSTRSAARIKDPLEPEPGAAIQAAEPSRVSPRKA